MSIELQAELGQAVEQRRNFAIISHPDAGKTTLTEIRSRSAGAIHEEGEVKACRDQRKYCATWIVMGQPRGIFVTTTVLQTTSRHSQID